jgi:hypothetical protein
MNEDVSDVDAVIKSIFRLITSDHFCCYGDRILL